MKKKLIEFRPGVFAYVGERHFAEGKWWVFRASTTGVRWRAEKGRKQPPAFMRNQPLLKERKARKKGFYNCLPETMIG